MASLNAGQSRRIYETARSLLLFLLHPLMFTLYPWRNEEFSMFRYKVNYYIQMTIFWLLLAVGTSSLFFTIVPTLPFDPFVVFLADLFPAAALYLEYMRTVITFFQGYFTLHLDCFAFFFSLQVLGYAYVSTVTCRRGVPFSGRSGEISTFLLKFTPMSIPVYFIGPAYVLWSSDGPGGVHSKYVALGYNIAFFFLPYLVGLHFTYLDHLKFLQETGDRVIFSQSSRKANFLTFNYLFKLVKPALWKTLEWKQILFIIAIAVPIALDLLFTVVCLVFERYILIYIILYIAFLAFHAATTVVILKWYDIHIHHYLWGLLFVPALRCNNPITCSTQAVMLGIYVEGVSRWGMALLYDRKGRGSEHLLDTSVAETDPE